MLPPKDSDLVNNTIKDPYIFDFITLKEEYKEKELEEALITKIRNVLLDLLMDKNRKNHPKDKKTDWFYDNEQFDRKMDERADKNNYRTL